MAGGDEAQSAAAAEKPSEMELLRGMLQQQLELAAAAARREDRMAALMERVLPGPTAVQDATAPAQAAAGPDSGARPRARMPAAGTPTPRLAATATLKEFEAWKEKFSGYCLLTGVHDLTEAEQRAALLAVLDDDWARVVRFGLPIPAEASMADVITAMHAHLRRQRNVVIDRCEFNMRMLEPGESVDDFICALKEIASCCDFCPNCTDDRFRDHLVVGTSDDEARRRMLELPDLTFQMAADLCRASESARLNSSAIRGPGKPSLRRLSEYRRQRGRPSGADSRPADQTRRCDRCGAAQHTDGRACPALVRTCHRCHERDHFSSVCRHGAGTEERRRQTPSSERSHQGQDWRHRSASSSRQGRGRRHRSAISRRRVSTAADASHRQVSVLAASATTRDTGNRQQSAPPAARTPGARLNSVTAHRSPQVWLQLHLPNGVRRSTVWTPDTGAGISALSLQQAESMGVSRADLTPSTAVLWAADSRRLDCVGTCALTLQLGDVIQTVQVSVLRALHSPLLSWHDCIGLGILPASFPRQICQRGSAAETGTDGGAPEPPPPGEPPEAPAAGRQPALRRCSGTTAAPEETRDLSRVSAADRPAGSSDGTVSGCRLTVDFTKLNRFVKRPTYPVRSPQDAVAFVSPGAAYFTKLDSKAGYHQVPIRPEDRDLTCFITPWGRYRYLSAPMGIVSSGDVYNQRGDAALGDIPRTCKVVDDVLAYDADYAAHLQHVRQILLRCDQHGITLNPDKCQFAEDEVEFCGFRINSAGYTADGKKVRAIQAFPRPGNITDLRPETDAARSGGLGYCLLQQDAAGRWRLIQCGSRFLSDAESRYAVIELELLALAWACKKCSIYLGGMQRFEVLTDHRPLIPILNSKSLAEIENPRLQRLRERLAPFNLLATWRQGKLHAIPDALSRAPVDDPTPEDEEAERDASHQLASVLSRLATDGADDSPSPFKDAALTEVRAAAAADPELITLTDLILNGFPEHRSQLDPRLRPYWGVRDRLAVDDGLVVCGQRLVIPPSLRRATLERLHASHQGVERTKRRARQVVYWPFLDSDIANHVGACPACQQYLPSQQKEPLMPEKTPSRVFEAVSADFFAWAGRTFLVYADRLSGWPFVSHVAGEATARDLVCSLRQMSAATGVPTTLRTDGGPQFTARLTREFLRRWGVEHQISTPHYPQSNGHAESAVKAPKRLIQKATSSGELDTDAYAQGLLELRNTPRADGRSPAQVLFGHPLRSAVPAHHRSFADCWQRTADDCDARAAAQQQETAERYDTTARQHSALTMGQRVLVQDPRSGLWDRVGVITAVGQRRDYLTYD
ncbi:uncharacterized protein LOC122387025 [Amphibalanus amphitrite]|uniref:uncharacterized protein LOC122387025 n=1 Tax=Amphibalanus amphitrite TaxID=1232801 RepID=UPI001C919F25|nr:uncharacterized protein LOC122387025 [Amphibalanus amphitrite]